MEEKENLEFWSKKKSTTYCWKYRSYIVLIYLFILVFGICLERYLEDTYLSMVHVAYLVRTRLCFNARFPVVQVSSYKNKGNHLNCGVSSFHSCASWSFVPTPLVSCVTNPPILFYCTLPRRAWRCVLTGALYLFTQYMFDWALPWVWKMSSAIYG